jgi:hypothetical protein
MGDEIGVAVEVEMPEARRQACLPDRALSVGREGAAGGYPRAPEFRTRDALRRHSNQVEQSIVVVIEALRRRGSLRIRGVLTANVRGRRSSPTRQARRRGQNSPQSRHCSSPTAG